MSGCNLGLGIKMQALDLMNRGNQFICRWPANYRKPSLEIRVHGADGSVETLIQTDVSLVELILDEFQPARTLTQKQITIDAETQELGEVDETLHFSDSQ